jgi:hypothetical protein
VSTRQTVFAGMQSAFLGRKMSIHRAALASGMNAVTMNEDALEARLANVPPHCAS